MTSTLNLVLERSIDQYADYETVIDGILIDLTGYELKATIQRTYTSETGIDFEIEVLQATAPAMLRLSLSRHQTASMSPGRYVWDLVGTKDGITRRLREGGAIVQAGVTDPDIGGLDPNIIAAIDEAITEHVDDPDPHPQYLTLDELPASSTGGSFERTFTNTDLSIAGILPVTHNLNSYPSGVLIWNASGQLIEPTNIDILTLNAISIDLSEFAPLSGTWRTSITI